MPASDRAPEPRASPSKTVSAWSSRVWPGSTTPARSPAGVSDGGRWTHLDAVARSTGHAAEPTGRVADFGERRQGFRRLPDAVEPHDTDLVDDLANERRALGV